MTAMKDFFHDRKGVFYLSEQEKVNLQVLVNITYKTDTKIAILTNQEGKKGLGVVRGSALNSKQLVQGDILSNIMEGKSKRIKEIYEWLGTIDIHKRFPFYETAREVKIKKEKAKRPVIRTL